MRQERADGQLRPVTIERGFTEMTPGSVLIGMGRTRVLCTVSFDEERTSDDDDDDGGAKVKLGRQ